MNTHVNHFRFFRRFTAALFVFSVIVAQFWSPGVAWAQNSVGWDNYGQVWTYRDNNEKTPVIMGKLEKIKFNTGAMLFADWDINLFVLPDPNYNKYAINSNRDVNPPIEGFPAGRIEYEVKTLNEQVNETPDDNFRAFFRATFREGSSIEAKGFWVQDWGHTPWGPKTELHPIIYLRQPYAEGGFGLFVPWDISEKKGGARVFRFHVEPPRYQSFTYPIKADRDEQQIVNSGTVQSTASASIIFEKSMLDISSRKRSGFARGFVGYPSAPYYQVAVDLKEPDPKNAYAEGGHYHPFYLGQILERNADAFTDEVTTSVKPCAATALPRAIWIPGQKVVEVTIRVTLKPVNDPWNQSISWQWSLWKLTKANPYSDSLLESQIEQSKLSGSAANTKVFKRYYAPKLQKVFPNYLGMDFNNNEWLLAVKAASNENSLYSKPPKAGQGAAVETFLYKERMYSVATSQMIIVDETSAASERRDSYPQGNYNLEIHCSPSARKFLAQLKAMDGVNPIPDTFSWEVRPFQPDSELAWEAVDKNGNPWLRNGLEVKVDLSDKRRLFVTATPQVPAYQGFAGPALEIRASASTDLGEIVTASQDISWHECYMVIRPIAAVEPLNVIENLYRGITAIEFLREQRRLPQQIPEDFARLLGAQPTVPWRGNRQAAIPAPYELLPRLTGQPRIALEAYYKFMAGMPINQEERQSLVRFTIEANKVKWATPPPRDAFDMLRKITKQR